MANKAIKYRVYPTDEQCIMFAKNTGDAFNFFDAFTGGSFTQMSIFALNITPYQKT